MRRKFAFIVPYIGKFPHWFQLWLDSCGRNPICDWLIFTDDITRYDYPDNVKVFKRSFDELRTLFQKTFDFPISIDVPYRFCDFKPAYGEIFADYLKDYDFWGFCDTDLIWGNLEKWLSSEEVDHVDRISHWGHCTLLRNTPEMNSLYRQRVEGIFYYKDVYKNPTHVAFDEECGLNVISRAYGVKELVIPFFDVKPVIQSYGLEPTYVGECFFTEPMGQKLVRIAEKDVLAYGLGDHGQLVKKDFAYVHLQKRPMRTELHGHPDHYLIVPNRFVEDRPVTEEVVRNLVIDDRKAMIKRHQLVWKSRIKFLLGKK